MPQLHLIDTFSEFLAYWRHAQDQPMLEQIEAWGERYMHDWPELRQKQIDCYIEDGDDWRAIAREHIFPFLADYLPTMRVAHDNLLAVIEPINGRYRQLFDFPNDLVCIIYMGIGCGAGWATTYAGKPAILFGLENIAAEQWQAREALSGMMAHELGHILHFYWREQAGLVNETDVWWQLYTEGFAQWCEGLIQGRPSWHMQTAVADEWLTWCQANLRWLAGEFLRRVESGEDMRPFFGSWFDLRGYKQTGYFLGYELVKRLHKQASLHDIALLTNTSSQLRPLLTELAA